MWLLLLLLATWPILAPDGTRQGYVREDFGRSTAVDLFDNNGQRTGWGRRATDGTVDLFDKDGKRLGTVNRDGVLRLDHPLQKGK